MPTNLCSNGDYPLHGPMEDNVEVFPSFDTLWREELSLIPEAPNDWKEREVFRVFAKKIYDRIACGNHVQNIANTAYNDGYDDGVESARKGARQLLEKALKEVDDI